MKKFVKKLILLFISIQFAACEGNLEPHLYGVVDLSLIHISEPTRRS